MVSFIIKYDLISNSDFVVTDQVRMRISATFVMLTFGMRHYLINVVDRIIIKPEYHKGEFNVRLKTVLFSWKDFYEGCQFQQDNLNLGLHEVSHALYLDGLKGKDQSSILFLDTYVERQEYLIELQILNNLIVSNYFRIYAYPNQIEFIAVVVEHFFETPEIFKKEVPELFEKVKTMINH